jgi:hypothetical protein
MKTYIVRLSDNSGQIFDSEFSSPRARLALNAAMDAAKGAIKLAQRVEVISDKGEVVWDNFGEYLL